MKYKAFALLTVLALLAALVGVTTPAKAAGYGTNFTTSITYQNVGTADANVALDFYSAESGTAIPITLPVLAANAGSSLFVGSLAQVSSGFKGSAVMSSDQPLVATLVQVPPNGSVVKSRPLSNSSAGGASSVLVPTVIKNMFGYTSVVSIQNVDTVGADLTVEFIPVGASIFSVTVTNLPSGAAKYYDMGSFSNPSIGANFNGSMRVTAKKTGTTTAGSIVATSLEAGTANNFAYAFEGATQFANKVYMPSAFCRWIGASYMSYYAVQNVGTSPIDITVTYSNSNTETYSNVAGGAKVSISGCGASNTLNPTGFIGSAVLTATGNIAAMAKIQNNAGLATAFLGFNSAGNKIALPYARWTTSQWNNGVRQRSYLAIQNIGTTDLASGAVTVKYYDKDGLLKGTHTLGAIPVAGKVNSDPTLANALTSGEFGYYGTAFGGSAVVEGPGGSSLAVVVRVQSINSGEDYNGFTVAP